MKRFFSLIELSFFYLKEIIASNLKVSRDVLDGGKRISPRIEHITTGSLTERQLFVLANMITMTPGTLAIDVDQAEKTLKIHTLYQYQKDELQKIISNQFERRVTNVF